jgi:hypothetical protein
LNHAALFEFIPTVIKSPGTNPIDAQKALRRSAWVPYFASQAEASA